MLAIGYSAGGLPLLMRILQALPEDYPLAVVVVTHLPGGMETNLDVMLSRITKLPVTLVMDKESVRPCHIYIAPPDYHLLVERHPESAPGFALSVDAPVKSVRPSIDVFLESAAEIYEHDLIAVVLSGANSDGAEGMACAKKLGGLSIVQDPQESEFSTMPAAVIQRVRVDYVASTDEIISLLLSVHEKL